MRPSPSERCRLPVRSRSEPRELFGHHSALVVGEQTPLVELEVHAHGPKPAGIQPELAGIGRIRTPLTGGDGQLTGHIDGAGRRELARSAGPPRGVVPGHRFDDVERQTPQIEQIRTNLRVGDAEYRSLGRTEFLTSGALRFDAQSQIGCSMGDDQPPDLVQQAKDAYAGVVALFACWGAPPPVPLVQCFGRAAAHSLAVGGRVSRSASEASVSLKFVLPAAISILRANWARGSRCLCPSSPFQFTLQDQSGKHD